MREKAADKQSETVSTKGTDWRSARGTTSADNARGYLYKLALGPKYADSALWNISWIRLVIYEWSGQFKVVPRGQC